MLWKSWDNLLWDCMSMAIWKLWYTLSEWFRRTKLFGGQNFRHQVEISAVLLYDEVFSSVSYFAIQFTWKICVNIRFVLIWHVLDFSGQNISADKIFGAQNCRKSDKNFARKILSAENQNMSNWYKTHVKTYFSSTKRKVYGEMNKKPIFVGQNCRNFELVSKICPPENFVRRNFFPPKFCPIRYCTVLYVHGDRKVVVLVIELQYCVVICSFILVVGQGLGVEVYSHENSMKIWMKSQKVTGLIPFW